ncbi:YwqG family protein [Lysobacter sp. 1R34A]|uniref:YwqG family protein n=1 Tax=Lysobacter sp. 1R34A TaxID=3445786 RepID=UPI003EED0BC5
MKTGTAVLLSMAIVAVGVAAVAGVGYAVYRGIEGQIEQGAAQARADAGLPDSGEQAPGCGSKDDDAQAKAVLAPADEALLKTQRPVARIELSALARDDTGVSKVGGQAYWAAGRDYPRDAKGQPLFLLAQINLAEVPKMPGYPERGLLQFFISGDDYYGAALDDAHGASRMDALANQTGFRVVYWPELSAAAIAPPKATAGADSLPFDPAKPRRMRFTADHETIGVNDAQFGQALEGGVEPLIERYRSEHPGLSEEDLQDALRDYLARSGHKLGGYPDFTQSDPREPSDRRLLLFQLDSDDALMWGDSGIANFFIDPADLARADFSRVSYHWDCY